MHADRILDTPPAPTTRRGRNIELDWLRAYAVLLVVSLHLTLLLAPGPRVTFALFHTLNFGAGVDLFFAISGFVIAGSLEPLWALPTFPRGRVPPGFIRDFFIRRFWRLWPASTLWISCCLLAAWACAGRGGWPPVGHVAGDWATVLVPVYELRGFWHPGVLGYNWSLSVEWQFYAIFPFLLVALRSGGARASAFVLLFAFSLYTFEISFMLRFSSIIGGIAVHALHRTGWLTAGSPATPHRWVRLWLTPLLLAVVVTVPQLAHQPLIGQPVRTLLCTLLVAMAAAERRLTADCGLRSLLAWIGLRSYSLYLCHVPVALTLLAALDWLHDNRADRDTGLSLLLIGIAAAIALGWPISATGTSSYRSSAVSGPVMRSRSLRGPPPPIGPRAQAAWLRHGRHRLDRPEAARPIGAAPARIVAVAGMLVTSSTSRAPSPRHTPDPVRAVRTRISTVDRRRSGNGVRL